MQNAQLCLRQSERPEFSDIPHGKLHLNDCTACFMVSRDEVIYELIRDEVGFACVPRHRYGLMSELRQAEPGRRQDVHPSTVAGRR